MAAVCDICGKKPRFGNNVPCSRKRTRRRFNPNLQRVRILVNGAARRAYVCARCLKSGRVEKAA